MKRSQREKERQTGRQRQAQTAEVQKQRHKDKGKQGVYEDWVRMSSLNAFCYFHAIDANAKIVFFRIMFQPRYCRWISDRRGMWESTHTCITFKRNQPSHNTFCLANRRVQNINTKLSIMLSVYELFLKTKTKKFRSTGRIFKTLFWYYSQFLIFVVLVTDSGTGCIQQPQVFYVLCAVRATTLVSHTSAACSVTSPEEQDQRGRRKPWGQLWHLTVCVLYSPSSQSLSSSRTNVKF